MISALSRRVAGRYGVLIGAAAALVVAAALLLAFASNDGPPKVTLITPPPSLTPELPGGSPAWAELAAGTPLEDPGLYVVDIETGTSWRLEPAVRPEARVVANFLGWTPDGAAIAEIAVQLDNDGKADLWQLYEAQPGSPFELYLPRASAFRPSRFLWSPDERFLVVSESYVDSSEETFWVYDLPADQETFRLPGRTDAWSSDSRFLSYHQAGLGVLDTATGKMAASSVEGTWSRRGARLAYIASYRGWSDRPGPSELRIRDFATGSDVLATTVDDPPMQAPSWSADDQSIALTVVNEQGGTTTLIIDADGGEAKAKVHGSVSAGWSSRDDALLLSGNICAGIDIFTVRSDGTTLRNLTESDDAEMAPSWSPDGRKAAFIRYGQGTSALTMVATPDGEAREIAESGLGSLGALGWSPDGRYFVVTLGEGFGFCEGEEPQITSVEVLAP